MDKRNSSLLHSNTFLRTVAVIVSTSFILTSCGGGGNKSTGNGFNISAQMVAVENIDSNQRNIATRICYAYQSKNSNFNSSDFLGSKFTFSLNQKTCAPKTNSSNFTAILKRSNFSFTYSASNVSDYYQYVQTNTIGYLAQICTKINSNQPISNTIDYNGNTVQINFFTDTMDGYKLSYFTMDKNNSYKINSAETFRVRTQSTFSSSNILGMDESYSRQQICPADSSKYSELDQKFISHN